MVEKWRLGFREKMDTASIPRLSSTSTPAVQSVWKFVIRTRTAISRNKDVVYTRNEGPGRRETSSASFWYLLHKFKDR